MGRRMDVLIQKQEKKLQEDLAKKAKPEKTAVKAPPPNIKEIFAHE